MIFRRNLLWISILLASFIGGLTAHEGPAVSATNRITVRAVAFLDSLNTAQRRDTVYSFDSPQRRDWHFTPRSRPGIRIDRLDAGQQELAWALLDAALSETGYRKVWDIIRLEGILGEITGRPDYRDPGDYALAFFGEPRSGGRTDPWGWRFEGHHLSLTFTVVPGHDVAFTPAFYGTNPAVVPRDHPESGWRVLEAEHRLAFDLLGLLDDGQREKAILSDRTPGNIITGPGREEALAEPEGLSFGEMTGRQRLIAGALIDVYLDNVEAPYTVALKARLTKTGRDRIRFAWAGSTRPDEPHYYRLHGPGILIEYDNTQGGGNHVHSVWHDPANPFGEDLLRSHRENHPH